MVITQALRLQEETARGWGRARAVSAPTPAAAHSRRCRVLLGVCIVVSTSSPCWGGPPHAVEPAPPAESEYRLGVDLFAASFGVVVPLAPAWRIGGAGGVGFSVGPAWTTMDEFTNIGLADVVRAEALVSRTLDSYAWLDMGIAAGLSGIAGDDESLAIGSSLVAFVEPLLGWRFLRFGSRVSGGYWINLDGYYGTIGEPSGFVLSWKLITAKLVW